MKTLLPNTKFYKFSRKFWQVTAYLELFFGGGAEAGAEISLGAAAPPSLAPLGTAPGSDLSNWLIATRPNRAFCTHSQMMNKCKFIYENTVT